MTLIKVDTMLNQMKQEMMLEIKNNLMTDPTLDFVGIGTDANTNSNLLMSYRIQAVISQKLSL